VRSLIFRTVAAATEETNNKLFGVDFPYKIIVTIGKFIIPTLGRHSFRMPRNDVKALQVHNTRRDHLLCHVLCFFLYIGYFATRMEFTKQLSPIESDVQNHSLRIKKARYRVNKRKKGSSNNNNMIMTNIPGKSVQIIKK